MALQKELSLHANTGNKSQKVTISSTNAASSAIPTDNAVIYATVDCFMRAGAAPVAVATGVDQFIPASTLLRVTLPQINWKLAFITSSASGLVYITPGA